MADTVAPEVRSAIMRAVKSRNTGPERTLFGKLARAGLHFRKWPDAPGSPDALLILPRGWLAVWVHGCFWHVCPTHARWPKSNRDFWEEKLRRNVERDAGNLKAALAAGYGASVVWECQLKGLDARNLMRRP